MKNIFSGICLVVTMAMVACTSTAWAQGTPVPATDAGSASQTAATCATPGKNGYDKNCLRYPDADTWPKSCEQAVAQIVAKLDEASKQRVREVSYENLMQFHNGWGMGIRNNTGLWRGNVALTESCMALDKEAKPHPDDISVIIIQEIWKKLHESVND